MPVISLTDLCSVDKNKALYNTCPLLLHKQYINKTLVRDNILNFLDFYETFRSIISEISITTHIAVSGELAMFIIIRILDEELSNNLLNMFLIYPSVFDIRVFYNPNNDDVGKVLKLHEEFFTKNNLNKFFKHVDNSVLNFLTGSLSYTNKNNTDILLRVLHYKNTNENIPMRLLIKLTSDSNDPASERFNLLDLITLSEDNIITIQDILLEKPGSSSIHKYIKQVLVLYAFIVNIDAYKHERYKSRIKNIDATIYCFLKDESDLLHKLKIKYENKDPALRIALKEAGLSNDPDIRNTVINIILPLMQNLENDKKHEKLNYEYNKLLDLSNQTGFLVDKNKFKNYFNGLGT